MKNHDKPSGWHLNEKGKAIVALGLFSAGAALGFVGKDKVDAVREENKLYNQTVDPNAMQNYQTGVIDQNKVVVVTAKESGTAWDTARTLDPKGEVRPEMDAINAQAGPDGVQAGEQFVIRKADLPKQDS